MKLFKFILYLWQLPQNILGIILHLWMPGTKYIYSSGIDNINVYKSAGMSGGISLGKYVIVYRSSGTTTIKHELGHCKQSQYLGWFYLIIIGLPSIVWATLHTYNKKIAEKYSYYSFYTERWADKLGGVVRNKK